MMRSVTIEPADTVAVRAWVPDLAFDRKVDQSGRWTLTYEQPDTYSRAVLQLAAGIEITMLAIDRVKLYRHLLPGFDIHLAERDGHVLLRVMAAISGTVLEPHPHERRL